MLEFIPIEILVYFSDLVEKQSSVSGSSRRCRLEDSLMEPKSWFELSAVGLVFGLQFLLGSVGFLSKDIDCGFQALALLLFGEERRE